jgi:hypothetical protein
MSQTNDDKNEKTLQIIEKFLLDEAKINEFIRHRSRLLEDVIEYVKIINTALFSWASSTDDYLREHNLGSVNIVIDEQQPQLFSIFEDFLPKDFPVLHGSMTIKILAKNPFSMKAKILFTRHYGKFIWDVGEEERFFSECYLAQNHGKFGNWDLFDVLSYFTFRERDIYIDGQRHILKHPADVINEKLVHRSWNHVMAGKVMDGSTPVRSICEQIQLVIFYLSIATVGLRRKCRLQGGFFEY